MITINGITTCVPISEFVNKDRYNLKTEKMFKKMASPLIEKGDNCFILEVRLKQKVKKIKDALYRIDNDFSKFVLARDVCESDYENGKLKPFVENVEIKAIHWFEGGKK